MKPFSEWTDADVEAWNASVAKGKRGDEKCDAIAVKPIPDKQAPSSLVPSTVIRTSNTGGSAHPVSTNTRQFVIHTDPVPAPRMTKRDSYRVTAKYPRRPCVARYFAFQDTLQRAVGDLPIVPDEVHCVFHVPMPDSWPKSKRQRMIYAPHKQRGDGDNYMKAVLDSLFLQDGGVWKGSFEKHWSEKGRIEITMVWLTSSPLTTRASEALEQERTPPTKNSY